MHAVEICIACDTVENVCRDVGAVHAGGAVRVELCGQMRYDGLTPAAQLIGAARAVFPTDGLMAMIRPRKGDFVYSPDERGTMGRQIRRAAGLGADGVVVGALRAADHGLDNEVMAELVDLGKAHGLQVTMHRAFDATPNRAAALEQLIDLGVDRVLTSGTPWASGLGALHGIGCLQALIRQAAGRIEVVIGGGVGPANAAALMQALAVDKAQVSVHAYSGVQAKGRVQVEQVKALVHAVNRR